MQYLNTVIPYEKKGSPPSVEDLQMLTNSEYSFKLLFWVSIRCFGDTKAHFALGYRCSTARLGDFFCIIAAWAI